MEITRYDGTRFITEEEIDEEFTDCYALIRLDGTAFRDGYLIAVATDDEDENPYAALSKISFLEYGDTEMTIVYGCKTRGQNLHVELLG